MAALNNSASICLFYFGFYTTRGNHHAMEPQEITACPNIIYTYGAQIYVLQSC